jgi:hypothetical protein
LGFYYWPIRKVEESECLPPLRHTSSEFSNTETAFEKRPLTSVLEVSQNALILTNHAKTKTNAFPFTTMSKRKERETISEAGSDEEYIPDQGELRANAAYRSRGH